MATKISLKQLGEDVLKLIRNGSASSLEKDIVSNTICGAAASGTIFPQGQTFTEFAEKILRRDIVPTISTSFSGTGIKEKGTTINGSTIGLTISNLEAVTVPINTINFYVGNVLVDSKPFVSGQVKYQYIYDKTITQDTTIKAELIYNSNQKISGTGSFSFVYASYYGTTTLSAISDSEADSLISSLTKNVKNTKSLTWENIILNDERFCYMYPVSLGLLSSIKDGNGFEQINGYTRFSVNITSPISSDIVPYYVYLLSDSATGSGFKQIYA